VSQTGQRVFSIGPRAKELYSRPSIYLKSHRAPSRAHKSLSHHPALLSHPCSSADGRTTRECASRWTSTTVAVCTRVWSESLTGARYCSAVERATGWSRRQYAGAIPSSPWAAATTISNRVEDDSTDIHLGDNREGGE
jgi:hypothetical protein